jgi:hypothetical protein
MAGIRETELYPLSPMWHSEHSLPEWLPVRGNPVALWSKVSKTRLASTRFQPLLVWHCVQLFEKLDLAWFGLVVDAKSPEWHW